jgi:hypothetical protein
MVPARRDLESMALSHQPDITIKFECYVFSPLKQTLKIRLYCIVPGAMADVVGRSLRDGCYVDRDAAEL